MSHTIRRKNYIESIYIDYNCIVDDDGIVKIGCCGEWITPWRKRELKAKTCKELITIQLNHYHSDMNDWFNAPKFYRQIFNRCYRYKTNAQLTRALRDGVEDELLIDEHIKTANWSWF